MANKNYLCGIHVELEFIILEFLLCTSYFSSAFADSSSVFQIVVLFLWIYPLFFRLFRVLQISVFVLQICVFQIVSSDPHFLDRSSSSFKSGSSVLQIIFIFMHFPDCVFQIMSLEVRFLDRSSSSFGSSSSVLQIVFIFIFVL